jgi:thiol-disulfide isomerase/thioredoxin
MKNLLVLFIIILCSNEIFSSELNFKPEKAKNGDTVNVTFSGNSRFDKKKVIDLLYYVFDGESSFPTGYEIVLTKKTDKWTGKFVVPNNAVFILFKIFSSNDYIDIIDNNYGKYWEILIFDKDKPLRNAYLKSALSRLGSISSNIDRIPDFYEAIKLLEKELSNYNDNITAELGLKTTLFDMKKINSEEFSKRLTKISKFQINQNSEIEVKTMVKCLSAINEKSKSEELEKRFAANNPKSSIAEELIINRISGADNFNDFSKYSLEFFNKFPNSMNKDRIFTAFSTAYMQSNKINNLIQILDSIPNTPGYIYSRIAKNLFESLKSDRKPITPTNKELLLGLINKSESKIVENKSQKNSETKPQIYTPCEWEDLLDIQIATIKEMKAELLKEFEPINAAAYFENSIDLYRNYATEEIYENYIELLVSLGDSAKALKVAEQALEKGKSSDIISTYHSDAMRTLHYTNDSLYNIKLDSISEKRNEVFKEIYLNELLKKDEFQYSLETLEGTLIDFKDLTGKITVLNFFSSWCSPCSAMFPAFTTLYNNYLDNENVELVAVNTLENNKFTSDDLKKFVNQNEITFPVVRDILDAIPRQAGIVGLPTIAILDKKSRVRFLIRGFSNNESLINDVSGRIDFLMNLED